MNTRLPQDMAEFLKVLPWTSRLRCFCWRILADLFGFWKYPVRIDPDPVDYPDGELVPYWKYKARKPIVLPEKGSGLREYFQSHREPSTLCLPDGFRVEDRITLSAVGDLWNKGWSTPLQSKPAHFLGKNRPVTTVRLATSNWP